MRNNLLLTLSLIFILCSCHENEGLLISTSAVHQEISIGHPILFEFKLVNHSDDTLQIENPFVTPNSMKVNFAKPYHFVKRSKVCFRNLGEQLITVLPQKTFCDTLDLKDYYFFTQGGTVDFVFEGLPNDTTVAFKKIVSINIKSPSEEDLAIQKRYYELEDIQDWKEMSVEGLKFLEVYPDHPYSNDTRAVIANALSNCKEYQASIEMYHELLKNPQTSKDQALNYRNAISSANALASLKE